MHVLRVVAAGEIDDLGLGNGDAAVFVDGAGQVILEPAVFDRRDKIGLAQRHLSKRDGRA